MEIHLDNGKVLTLNASQRASLQGYVEHPSNQVPVFNPETTYTTYKQRWETTDDWITFVFNQALSGALLVVPSPDVVAIQKQEAILGEQKKKALELKEG